MKSQLFSKNLSALAAIALAFTFFGCGKGFTAGSLSNTNQSSSVGDGSHQGTGGNPTNSAEAFKAYPTDVAVAEGQQTGKQVVVIDKDKKELLLTLPMPSNVFLTGMQADFPIKEIPGAVLVVGPDADGNTSVVLHIPLAAVLHGAQILPSARLPNGDPLPAIPDGELPSVAIELSKLGNVTADIYLGPSVVGIYVNSPVNPFIAITVPLRNAARTPWGYFSSVPVKGTFQGGFFISAKLPDDLARIIDDIL